MLDSDTVIRSPHAATVTRVGGKKRVRVQDPRVSVAMKTDGVELVLFFADHSGEGDVLEVRVLPDTHPVSADVMSRIGRGMATYMQYARSSIRFDASEKDIEGLRSRLETIRRFGKTSRGLPEDHYRLVAGIFNSLVAEGSPHPVTALGKALHTDISNASRWVKEARRRGLIQQ